jgi:hypothetical protein
MHPRAIASVATRIVVGAFSGVFPSGEGRVAFSFGVFIITIALAIGVAISIAIDVSRSVAVIAGAARGGGASPHVVVVATFVAIVVEDRFVADFIVIVAAFAGATPTSRGDDTPPTSFTTVDHEPPRSTAYMFREAKQSNYRIDL